MGIEQIDIDDFGGDREKFASGVAEAAGIKMVDAGTYRVPSSDGKSIYTVTFAGRGDGDVHVWSCTCKAAAHGRGCKHVALVGRVNDHICNVLGLD